MKQAEWDNLPCWKLMQYSINFGYRGVKDSFSLITKTNQWPYDCEGW